MIREAADQVQVRQRIVLMVVEQVWRGARPVYKGFDDTLDIILLIILIRILLVQFLLFLLILLVQQVLREWIAAHARLQLPQRRRRVYYELSFQDFAIDDSRECLAKVPADLDQLLDLDLQLVLDVDFLALAHAWIVAGVEGGLNGVAVEDAELFEHDQAARALLLLFVGELAVREGE